MSLIKFQNILIFLKGAIMCKFHEFKRPNYFARVDVELYNESYINEMKPIYIDICFYIFKKGFNITEVAKKLNRSDRYIHLLFHNLNIDFNCRDTRQLGFLFGKYIDYKELL